MEPIVELKKSQLDRIEGKIDMIVASLKLQTRPQASKMSTKKSKPETKRLDADLQIAHEMYELIKLTVKMKRPNMDTWADDIRKLRVVDGIPHEKMMPVFRVANRDSFWAMNVRSPKKLRQHWDRLVTLSPPAYTHTKGECLDYYKGKKW